MKRKEPVRLYKKEEPKIPPITPFMIIFAIVIIGFIIGILLAIGCKSPYNMVWA